MNPDPGLWTLGGAWTLYFALHSALASRRAKAWVRRRRPAWYRGYRLAYNALALGLLLPLVAWLQALRGPWLWRWEGGWGLLADGLALGAGALFLYSLRYYDGGDFLGLRQWRGAAERPRLVISPLHRYVRHPWYSLALVILWTRDMDAARLLVSALVTAYLFLGARLEEGRLLEVFPSCYGRYRAQVPALVPRPWRVLSRREARRLDGCPGVPGDD